MRYLYLIIGFLLSYSVFGQDVLAPLHVNPYQGKFKNNKERNDKSSRVSKNIIYQFDTLSLPFKDDFSSNHFPTPDADTSNASRLTMFLLLRNGTPVGMTETFSLDTSFTYKVFQQSNDSLSNPIENASEEITYVDMTVFPYVSKDTTVWPPYTIYDTIGGGKDTVHFQEPDLVQEKVTKYILQPDPEVFWTDYYVYRNNSFPIDPPSIGVATFDGLDENGLPYVFDADVTGEADRMTSAPIDLSQVNNSDSVYFSFYYQPQGLSFDAPDAGDSLIVDFYNSTDSRWEKVWGVNGGKKTKPFENVMILVEDRFFSKGFQLRFRNRANLSGSFDHWHVDYVILDKGRNRYDTIQNDVTFVDDAPSFIKNYSSMPWFHYQINPSAFNKEDVELCFTNRNDVSHNVFYGIQLINKRDNFQYYRYPGSGKFVIVNSSAVRCQEFYIEKDATLFSTTLRPGDFDQAEIIEAKYSVDFRPTSTEPKDFFPSNDTLRKLQLFGNYYAYDDGTAEAGYGINGHPGNEIVNFYQMPVDDSLVGLNICFLPQAFDASKQKFKIVVYNSLTAKAIYESTLELQPKYTEQGEFAMYALDSLLPVNRDFYVGIKGLGSKSLNIGFDFNTDSRSQIFRRYDSTNIFTNPSATLPSTGSLMMRPVFKKLDPKVGLKEQINPFAEVHLYPNPSKGEIFIENLPAGSLVNIFDATGKLLLSSSQEYRFNLDELNPGIYFVQMSSKDGQFVHSEKIILSGH